MLQTRQFRALSRRLGLDRDWYLVLLAVTIGLVMGVAALAFIIPITLMEERIEELSGAEDSNMTWVILLLPIGRLACPKTVPNSSCTCVFGRPGDPPSQTSWK